MSYPQYTEGAPSLPDQPTTSSEQPATGRAAEAAQQGKQAFGDVAHTATHRASDVKDEAVRQARDLVGEARSQVSRQAGQQHHALVGNLRKLSGELDQMCRNSGESGIATEVVGQAQQRVATLADWLEPREPGQLLSEARDFARRRPGTFLIGALAAGVVAGRLARGAVEVRTDDAGAGGNDAVSTSSNTEPGGEPAEARPAYSPPVYSAPAPSGPAYSTPQADAPTQVDPSSGSWR